MIAEIHVAGWREAYKRIVPLREVRYEVELRTG